MASLCNLKKNDQTRCLFHLSVEEASLGPRSNNDPKVSANLCSVMLFKADFLANFVRNIIKAANVCRLEEGSLEMTPLRKEIRCCSGISET